MKLYLVRHGKTDDHSKQVRQSPNSKLGEEGIEQAILLADKIAPLSFDYILSSGWQRALETTQIICKRQNTEFEIIDYIHEQEHNPIVYGKPWEDVVALHYREQQFKNKHNLDWKYLNKGESRRDLSKRAAKFLEYLIKTYDEESVLVVSHGLFLSCLVALSQLGTEYSDRLFSQILSTLHFDNTSLSLLEYEHEQNNWTIRFLNDYTHLTKWPN